MLQLSHRPRVRVQLTQKLRLRRKVRQKPLMLQLSHRLRVRVLRVQRSQRVRRRPQRLNRDRSGDRVIVDKDVHVAVAVAGGEGVVSLADKVSTITVKKSLRPSFRTIPNSSKQSRVL
jgi:hypothetical protein